ncbi:GNAT family N-acetyltransferase [Nocardioides insulae]|uniref:GNAT family N-acetyltransferase n=1 Tax=Nocardioides insulae TaxID=394734 RepID=UPI0004079058|nr:GNAT family N-acetyltransferase [Nocardioides insulae]
MLVTTGSFAQLDARTVYAVARLRQDVFVVEQECAYPDLDGRDLDPHTTHVLLHEGDDLVGYARLLDEGTVWRIGRVVLARAVRGRGRGDALMGAILEHAQATDPSRDILLDGQSPLVEWYTTHGFEPDGDEFLEDGIPHTPMRRRAA